MESRVECKLISITNGDNAYGTNVVKQVLGVNNIDMILNSVDSRNFLDQGN